MYKRQVLKSLAKALRSSNGGLFCCGDVRDEGRRSSHGKPGPQIKGCLLYTSSLEFPDPVIQVAIEPKTKAGQDKMNMALVKLAEEDPVSYTHL